MTDQYLYILGSFGTLALGINAFFLKGIYSELNGVKIKMTEIYTDSTHANKEIDILRDKYHNLVNEVQTLKLKLEKHTK